jgi:peptide/nickel transport system ATP-binding protein
MEAQDNTPLLSIHNLTMSFSHEGHKNMVLQNISLEVGKGEVLGIVGESGSGKTLLSLATMQLLPNGAHIDKGQILFRRNGLTDILRCDEKKLQYIRGREISMIFQEPMSSLNPTHKCGRQVEEIIRQHHPSKSQETIKNEVLLLFQKVKLPDIDRLYDSYIHQLSGGQLQRIMIAIAIANKPSLIIADEPTTALDVTVQQSIIELLIDLKNEFGCSIIFISHDLGVIKKIADRIVVLQKGILVEQGSTHQVFHQPTHLYTKGLIACRPPLDHRMKRLPTVRDFISTPEEDQAQMLSNMRMSKEEYIAKTKVIEQSKVLLKATNICKFFPSKKNFFGKVLQYTKAVDNVSFEIREGETLGLVGESGCGKSTLGRTILKLIDPTSGTVEFNGRDVFSMENHDLKKMRKDFQIIFQDPYSSLNPKMKIGEAVMEPMTIHNILETRAQRKAKVIELLEIVGMSADHYGRYPHQFSGGQRQRINIARTLSLNPKFIVCDESVSALDVSVQAQVLNLLSDLKMKFGLSYLFISHDISVIKHISDNVIVMKSGVIVEQGDAESIYHNPQQEYTQRLIEAVPK